MGVTDNVEQALAITLDKSGDFFSNYDEYTRDDIDVPGPDEPETSMPIVSTKMADEASHNDEPEEGNEEEPDDEGEDEEIVAAAIAEDEHRLEPERNMVPP